MANFRSRHAHDPRKIRLLQRLEQYIQMRRAGLAHPRPPVQQPQRQHHNIPVEGNVQRAQGNEPVVGGNNRNAQRGQHNFFLPVPNPRRHRNVAMRGHFKHHRNIGNEAPLVHRNVLAPIVPEPPPQPMVQAVGDAEPIRAACQALQRATAALTAAKRADLQGQLGQAEELKTNAQLAQLQAAKLLQEIRLQYGSTLDPVPIPEVPIPINPAPILNHGHHARADHNRAIFNELHNIQAALNDIQNRVDDQNQNREAA
jgi:hypothetical protein